MNQLLRHGFFAALACAVPVAAWADTSNTVTLSAGTGLNLNTGATGTSGGDILWTGSAITFVSPAKAFDLPGNNTSTFSLLGMTEAQSDLPLMSSSPIPVATLATGNVFLMQTMSGSFAKLLVTAQSGASITLLYVTFAASAPAGPTITSILNNYALTPAGFPNYGIAPGSLFIVKGSGLASATSVSSLQNTLVGLPQLLNGASMTVTASNGAVVHPAFYYAIASQLAAVLPSSTPPGNGMLTVNYNGGSATAAIQIVPSAMGLDTYFGAGSGLIVATDLNGNLLTYTNSAKPGQTITFWGSGLGADTADSDTVFTMTPHAVDVPFQIYIGQQLAVIVYKGSSGYPGVDIIDVTVPLNITTGCNVSVIGISNSDVVTNSTSLPVANGGGVCTDTAFGTNGTQLQSLSGQGTVKFASLLVAQSTMPNQNGVPGLTNTAIGRFQSETGSAFGAAASTVSVGGCIITQTVNGGGGGGTTGLDAGAVSVTGPAGSSPLTESQTGSYIAQLAAAAIPSTGGSFTFNGAGGKDVGSFSANITFPNPLMNWTNQPDAATISRGQGLTVNWTGGAPGTLVYISGSSSSNTAGVSASYSCYAPQSAFTFTVPNFILLALPAGSGSTMVENSTSFTTFQATGLDTGLAFGAVAFSVNSIYN